MLVNTGVPDETATNIGGPPRPTGTVSGVTTFLKLVQCSTLPLESLEKSLCLFVPAQARTVCTTLPGLVTQPILLTVCTTLYFSSAAFSGAVEADPTKPKQGRYWLASLSKPMRNKVK